MKKISLPTVTLCAVSSVKINETMRALQKSMEGIEYAKVLFLTSEQTQAVDTSIEIVPIQKLDYNQYSYFVLYELQNYIETDFVLLVQHDGYVLRPNKWSDDFLMYDYIGAPWAKNVHFTKEGENVRVGNGGFSLRSKKILQAPTSLNLPFTENGTGFFHEDGVLCSYHRKQLENAGILFAPVQIAARFSHETDCAESVALSFGFHGSKLALPRIFWPIKKVLRKINIRL